VEFAYHWEALGDEISVCVSPQHKFGTDAFLLSDFAAVRRKDTACDLGTGCGIVALLWFRQRQEGPKRAVCVDIQPQAIAQLESTVAKNGLGERVSPLLADLTALPYGPGLPRERFDLVTCNPPYIPSGDGIVSESAADQLARHETACDIDDVCRAAASLLRYGGRFCLCQRPERLCDVMNAMRRMGVEPKRLRFVQQHADTAPWLFLIEGKKGGKRFLQVEKPLIIEGEDGFSQEMLKIYRKM